MRFVFAAIASGCAGGGPSSPPPDPTALPTQTPTGGTTGTTADTGPGVVPPHVPLEPFIPGYENVLGTTLFILDGQAIGYSMTEGPIHHGKSAWWTPLDLLGVPEPGRLLNLGNILNVGDVTGDGIEDLALYRNDGGANPTVLSHGLVPGPLSAYPSTTIPGEFGPPGGTYWAITDSYDLGPPNRCGDVNGDGIDDLCGSRGVDYGPPDGVQDVTFSPQIRLPTYPMPAFDMDGDGMNEIYTSWGLEISRIVPVSGTTDTETLPTWTGTDPIQVITLADLGAGPVLLVAMGTELCTIDEAQFITGEGCTTLAVPGGVSVSSLAAGDFDGDGLVEVAVGHRTTPSRVDIHDQSGFLRRRLPGTFVNLGFGGSMVTGDLHLDGINDLLITESSGGAEGEGLVHYYRDPLVGY